MVRRMKAARIAVILLIAIGIILSFMPVSVYYSSEYVHAKFHDRYKQGAVFDYIIGDSFGSRNYGILFNITYIGGDTFNTTMTVYSLNGTHVGFNVGLLPNIPFYGNVSLLSARSKEVNYNSTAFLRAFISNKATVNSSIINTIISNNSEALGPEALLGYPYYHLTSEQKALYLKYGNSYVLGGFGGGGALNLTPLFSEYGVNFTSKNTLNTAISLGYTNDIPKQDWHEWFIESYYSAYPLNLALIAGGMILGIINIRRSA